MSPTKTRGRDRQHHNSRGRGADRRKVHACLCGPAVSQALLPALSWRAGLPFAAHWAPISLSGCRALCPGLHLAFSSVAGEGHTASGVWQRRVDSYRAQGLALSKSLLKTKPMLIR